MDGYTSKHTIRATSALQRAGPVKGRAQLSSLFLTSTESGYSTGAQPCPSALGYMYPWGSQCQLVTAHGRVHLATPTHPSDLPPLNKLPVTLLSQVALKSLRLPKPPASCRQAALPYLYMGPPNAPAQGVPTTDGFN